MGRISEKLCLTPDIVDDATIVNLYGKELAYVENYQSILDFSPDHIQLKGKHACLMIHGNKLKIERFTKEDCKITGEICFVEYLPM